MSILISGIDMPKKDSVMLWILPNGIACVMDDSDRQYKVIEIPAPHGRLVDINTILHDSNRGCIDELINDPELSELIKVGVSAARVIICSAPTIIEAEE